MIIQQLQMNLVGNQRRITIKKEEAQNIPANYCGLQTGTLNNAIQELKPSALYLYLYLSLNFNNDDIVLFSSKPFLNYAHISQNTYYTAWNELVEKRYLVNEENEEYKNSFIFYTTPQTEGGN